MSWNQSSEEQICPRRTVRKRPGVAFVAAILAAFVAVAAVALFLKNSGPNAPCEQSKEKGSLIEDVGRAESGHAPLKVLQVSDATVDGDQSKSDMYQGKRVIARMVVTNDNGTIDETIKTIDGKTYGHHRVLKPSPFANPTDQLIALATSTPPGGLMPPLPPMTKEDTDRFIESITTPMVISDEDDDAIRSMKERVNKMREEIAAILAAEPNIELKDLLTEHREVFNENSRLHNEAQAEYDKIVQSGDAEGAKEYLNKMNDALRQMGVPEITEATEEEDDQE